MNTLFVTAILAQSAFFIAAFLIDRHLWRRHMSAKEREWNAERRDLLDRIQAPNFGEYTRKALLEKKLEQQPAEKEERVEFIS
jgi:Spy/CpxP family protein refolding chaperone